MAGHPHRHRLHHGRPGGDHHPGNPRPRPRDRLRIRRGGGARATCWCAWTPPPEEAQLRALEAQEELATLNLARERTLRSQNMVSQAELDAAEATLKQIQGNADAIRATIEKKTIRAPFAGRLGIRLVNLGQYLDTGKPIVSLQSLDAGVCGFLAAAAGAGPAQDRHERARHDRRLSGAEV